MTTGAHQNARKLLFHAAPPTRLPVLAAPGLAPVLGCPGPCTPFGVVAVIRLPTVLTVVVLATTGLIVVLGGVLTTTGLIVVLGGVLATIGLIVVLGAVLATTGLIPSTSREEGLTVLPGGHVCGHRRDSYMGDMLYDTGDSVELTEGRAEVGVVVAFVVVGSVLPYYIKHNFNLLL